ncbi:MAG: aminotransferase class I/II-fold pyridoxal phosphate-dependent enzyme [Trueperaceae bacterium]|nr:MAG: aminotransferase class I/II-fold pyridoxal phosphate-dependent enzyme [Trueperaceae bacterium]
MIQAAHRVENLYESVIRSITVHAIQKGAINLGQGSPDFDPPRALIEAAQQALSENYNQYAPTWGLAELREAISDKTEAFYGFRPDPDTEVTVTCGVTEAVISALVGLVDRGDKVVILEPAHENYHAGVVFAGAEPLWVPIRPPDFTFDPDELRRAFRQPKVKAVIFNTPHNPSGRVFSREELQQIADLCLEFGVIAISDEIYEHMVFDGRRHIPISTLPGMMERTITISGLSKSYSVTGWRVGYALATAHLTDALRKIHDFTTICAPTPLQKASVTALRLGKDYYDWLTSYYDERRQRMMQILEESGFVAPIPEGAYYTLADFRPVAEALGIDDDDDAFTYWMIDEIGIGTVPGSSFYRSDPSLGRGRVRFAFPKKDETLDEVARRFERLRVRVGI